MEKSRVLKIRKDIEKALKPICIENGIAFSLSSIKHSENHCKLTFEGTDVSGDIYDESLVISKPEADFPYYCEKYGFSENDIFRKFEINKKIFKLTGIKPQNRKYPMIAKSMENGKDYKFTTIQVAENFLK